MGDAAAAHPEGEADVAHLVRARAAFHAARNRVVEALMPMAAELADAARAGMLGRVPRDEVLGEANAALVIAVGEFDGRGSIRRFAGQRILWRVQAWARKRTRHPEFSLRILLASLDS